MDPVKKFLMTLRQWDGKNPLIMLGEIAHLFRGLNVNGVSQDLILPTLQIMLLQNNATTEDAQKIQLFYDTFFTKLDYENCLSKNTVAMSLTLANSSFSYLKKSKDDIEIKKSKEAFHQEFNVSFALARLNEQEFKQLQQLLGDKFASIKGEVIDYQKIPFEYKDVKSMQQELTQANTEIARELSKKLIINENYVTLNNINIRDLNFKLIDSSSSTKLSDFTSNFNSAWEKLDWKEIDKYISSFIILHMYSINNILDTLNKAKIDKDIVSALQRLGNYINSYKLNSIQALQGLDITTLFVLNTNSISATLQSRLNFFKENIFLKENKDNLSAITNINTALNALSEINNSTEQQAGETLKNYNIDNHQYILFQADNILYPLMRQIVRLIEKSEQVQANNPNYQQQAKTLATTTKDFHDNLHTEIVSKLQQGILFETIVTGDIGRVVQDSCNVIELALLSEKSIIDTTTNFEKLIASFSSSDSILLQADNILSPLMRQIVKLIEKSEQVQVNNPNYQQQAETLATTTKDFHDNLHKEIVSKLQQGILFETIVTGDIGRVVQDSCNVIELALSPTESASDKKAAIANFKESSASLSLGDNILLALNKFTAPLIAFISNFTSNKDRTASINNDNTETPMSKNSSIFFNHFKTNHVNLGKKVLNEVQEIIKPSPI